MLEMFRQLGYPEIDPVPAGEHQPTWSVMIPTYNCAALLRETLNCVLAQAPGPERMQIEVVDDASTRDDPEAVVRELGAGRVAFYRHPKNVGATANFNACLARSRGKIVHVLHGDDLVLPGFYARMEDLLGRNPEAGSAICQYVTIDEGGVWTGMPGPKKRTAGIYADALPAIASSTWVQFASVVLKRSVVEAVGGFHPSLIHAADWDMWKRAALHRPVAYEPTVLACYRVFEGNDTSRLVATGANAQDIRRAIDLSACYLPSPEASAWLRLARRNYSEFASWTYAGAMLHSENYDGFHNQLRELCLLDPQFFWSREHLQLRYSWAKKRLKRALKAGKGRIMRDRLQGDATCRATTLERN